MRRRLMIGLISAFTMVALVSTAGLAVAAPSGDDQSLPALDGLIGLTYQELYAKWGTPPYAEFQRWSDEDSAWVFDRVNLSEWAEVSGGPNANGALGADLFLFTRDSVGVEYRISYVADHRASRWEPKWRVTSYTVKLSRAVPLGEAVGIVPEIKAFMSKDAIYYCHVDRADEAYNAYATIIDADLGSMTYESSHSDRRDLTMWYHVAGDTACEMIGRKTPIDSVSIFVDTYSLNPPFVEIVEMANPFI